jgi:plastocyanin
MSIAVRLALVVAAAVLIAACQGTALGHDRPPASLDPDSPTIAAINIAYDRSEVDVPAGEPFILVFENRDAVTHNISIYADLSLRDRKFEGVFFSGPATRWYPVPVLAAGTYVFRCDLHPSMAGRIVAS